jgi:hypothetical protein
MTTPATGDKTRSTDSIRRTSPLQLAAAWALVGVPLAWGVWQVVQRSMALFR